MGRDWIALFIFIFSYLSFVIFPQKRTLAAFAGGVLLILTRVLSWGEAFSAVNWNVMGIFVGTLAVADVFMRSRVPAYCAEIIVDKAKNTLWAILFICALTGFISAFVENVATVLIVAPIALSLAKKLKMNPVSMMIAIAVSSNLQGAATLIGDPPSMLLGGVAKMNFGDFFLYKGRLSIFFAVELGALASLVVLYFLFARHRQKTRIIPVEKVSSWVPTWILTGLIVTLALSSFIDTGCEYAAGMICMACGAVSLFWDRLSTGRSVFPALKGLDWDTTLFLASIFVIIGALSLTGWVDRLADCLAGLVGGNIFLAYTAIVFFSVIVSAFVDNVPFLAAMLPVAMNMSLRLNIEPALFLFGLLIGASLGGNITPIGASANIVSCGLLKKEGYIVRFGDFVKIGVPFTLAAVLSAYLFVWFVWK
ncbi:MAG: SLC13 family permease [Candidatus Omnitrophica bacterium]|nr:SLC13 family permease [Candidatus Omnitrophota bacterium]MDD5042236.1 SLC13 family permease [Candidatus Omnitrophota bacterium]MDD5500091.1 SLC13 family permease [Candidatus Omnitrophota bacterium]